MKNLARYIMDHYYAKMDQPMPDEDMLIKALDVHQDKIVVVHDKDIVLGVALFATLTDETFQNLEHIDIANVETLASLLAEEGKNIHFFLLTANGVGTILAGMKAAIRERKPRTISWWSPDMKRLHKRHLN